MLTLCGVEVYASVSAVGGLAAGSAVRNRHSSAVSLLQADEGSPFDLKNYGDDPDDKVLVYSMNDDVRSTSHNRTRARAVDEHVNETPNADLDALMGAPFSLLGA